MRQATQLDPILAIICLVLFVAIVFIAVKKGYVKAAAYAIHR